MALSLLTATRILPRLSIAMSYEIKADEGLVTTDPLQVLVVVKVLVSLLPGTNATNRGPVTT